MYRSGSYILDISNKYKTKSEKISKILKDEGCHITRRKSNNRNLNEEYFSEIDSSTKAYFIGLLFTDGSIVKDRSGCRSDNITLCLADYDRAILDVFKTEINCGLNLQYDKRDNRDNGTLTVGFRSNIMSKDLFKYGIMPNKTYVADALPTGIPVQYETDFIRGLIDGDGSIYFSKNIWHINFCTPSKNIACEFERRCSSLLEKDKPMKVQCSNGVYRITYNGQWAKRLAQLCYSNAMVGIPRKHRLAMTMLDNKQVEDIA